jgi:hypothetical protein
MKITKAEKEQILIALEFRKLDFINYTDKDLQKFPEVATIRETLNNLITKVENTKPTK